MRILKEIKEKMKSIEYTNLRDLDKIELLEILNKPKNRNHLVEHQVFNLALLQTWMDDKIKVNEAKGCRVKGIKVEGSVAGWCGIQYENEAYELAIILDEKHWGLGIRVFKELMNWALELGHTHVVLHLFNTRREYQFLYKMASRVYESNLFGERFTSYELEVKTFAG